MLWGVFPTGWKVLKPCYITGWNADYLQTFRKMLEREDLARELAPLRVVQQKLPFWTYVPQVPKGFDCSSETWVLDEDGPRVILDLLPQMVSLSPGETGTKEEAGLTGDATILLPGKDPYSGLVDINRLHAELKEYKVAKNYGNVFISRESLQGILDDRCELRMLKRGGAGPGKDAPGRFPCAQNLPG